MGSWFKGSHTMGAVGVRGSHNGCTGFNGGLTKRMQWGKTSLKFDQSDVITDQYFCPTTQQIQTTQLQNRLLPHHTFKL